MLLRNSTFFTLVQQLTGRGVTIFFDDSFLFVFESTQRTDRHDYRNDNLLVRPFSCNGCLSKHHKRQHRHVNIYLCMTLNKYDKNRMPSKIPVSLQFHASVERHFLDVVQIKAGLILVFCYPDIFISYSIGQNLMLTSSRILKGGMPFKPKYLSMGMPASAHSCSSISTCIRFLDNIKILL